ncbi:MAG TPA: Rossmann-like and DUF2520 domain-containing protein [Flavitalea sp.]|nr:Rossmann-like and DUF2520 domain-containing protein [Flavitalea sp.]
MRIVMIGSGNAASVLGRKIVAAGHTVTQVYSRNEQNAMQCAQACGASHTSDITSLDPVADLYVIAITDSALPSVKSWLALERKLVVHTAGTVSKEVLNGVSLNYGVLYPLQSMRKEMKHLPDIPFLVDGNTADDLTLIYDFAKSLSEKVEVANDQVRRQLHLAAVIVNNFSNHLFSLAEEFCKKENVNFELLLPLIEETALRLRFFPAKTMQTGPAMRNDLPTIDRHLEVLKIHPELRSFYEFFSASIMKGNSKK